MPQPTVRFPFAFRAALLVGAAAVLAACQTQHSLSPQGAAPSVHTASSAAALANAPVLRQDAFPGVYELATSADGSTVFVASTQGFDPQNAGFIYRLDARTLERLQTIELPRRAFGLGFNKTTGTLYAGNTMEGSIVAVDANSGIVKGVVQLAEPEINDKGQTLYAHARKVIVDEVNNRIFVTSPGKPGRIWVVDGNTHQVTHALVSDGIWTAGAAYDAGANILYVSQGGQNEILAIDPDQGRIIRAFSTGDSAGNTPKESKHFFINLALDAAGQRLFATDSNTGKLYVLDIASGAFVQQADTGGQGALDVIYNPTRNEVVVSNRGVGRNAPDGTGVVSILDGNNFAIKERFDLPVHPNSLALSPDGQTLYVTVKKAEGDKHPAFRKDATDSVVRIDLR